MVEALERLPLLREMTDQHQALLTRQPRSAFWQREAEAGQQKHKPDGREDLGAEALGGGMPVVAALVGKEMPEPAVTQVPVRGGGGGATTTGTSATTVESNGGAGYTWINGTTYGGGGGGSYGGASSGGVGGAGGGGAAGIYTATAGTVNTGGGGGGSGSDPTSTSGAGGSGIVIIAIPRFV